MAFNKKAIKDVLGEFPLTAELYWQIRQQGRPLSKSGSLRRTQKHLPVWVAQAAVARSAHPTGKRVMLFSTLRYWIEYNTLLAVSLAGLGHQVFHTYLPYTNWQKRTNRFDLRRQNAYIESVLKPARQILEPVSLLEQKPVANNLPHEIEQAIWDVSLRDVQYSLQMENVDLENPTTTSWQLFRLRQERNTQAALAFIGWIQKHQPEVIITPNGMILEMGVLYQVARAMQIPVVTYEFGEQRDRIWLARNAEVMRQETSELWAVRHDLGLDANQWQQVQELFASRQRASLWENFSRRWQGQPNVGGEKVRQELNLDQRPVVLLAANVIGDSLTLGRQVFSASMTEWLQHTTRYFVDHTDIQLVIRIHPGERYTTGPSVADVITQALPELPEHFRLVEANDPVNTYDLVEIADLGLVYTTTVGMEMAMSGVPVIVAGQTHYRGKGFTVDPSTWQEYEAFLDQILANPSAFRPQRSQVEQAWNYAYRFFFEFPTPFPWHLLHFWNELEQWSVEKALSYEGLAEFGESFEYLTGRPRSWVKLPSMTGTQTGTSTERLAISDQQAA